MNSAAPIDRLYTHAQSKKGHFEHELFTPHTQKATATNMTKKKSVKIIRAEDNSMMIQLVRGQLL